MMHVVRDWRLHEDDLPDVLPDDAYEHEIQLQMPCALSRILVRGHDLHLVRLQIGATLVPFKLYGNAGPRKAYQATPDQHPLLAGQSVRLNLHNIGAAAIKPRASLLVQEEGDL
jgi:hypothetical protein